MNKEKLVWLAWEAGNLDLDYDYSHGILYIYKGERIKEYLDELDFRDYEYSFDENENWYIIEI